MKESTNRKYEDMPRSANDCIAAVKQMGPAAMLFDEFWREGEVAVLYGPDRIGKSVLAVQIGEALARGRKIDGFQMPANGMKVLYVDLRLTHRQFSERYLLKPDGNSATRTYEFAENFDRVTPSDLTKIADWIRQDVEKYGYQAVIIDDLQTLQTRPYGAKDAIELMLEMRKLSKETGVSVLLIAGSEPSGSGKLPVEGDLRHLRAICRRADSTFAMARNCEHTEDRYLLQTRSPRRLYWTSSKTPICRMWSGGEVPVGFVFDERFRAEGDSERRSLILAIKQSRDHGESFESIARCFEIPKTKAFRLFREWRPSMEYTKSQIATAIAKEEAEEREALERARKAEIEEQQARVEFEENSAKMSEQLAEVFEPEPETAVAKVIAEPEAEPFVDTDPLSELTQMIDHTGADIFVEQFDDRGRPRVWYRFNRHHLKHVIRDANGTSGTTVDGPVCWLDCSTTDLRFYKMDTYPAKDPRDELDETAPEIALAGSAQFAVGVQMR